MYDALAGTKDASGHVIPGHWYCQYIAILFIGAVVPDRGSIYYFAVYRRKPIAVLREHAAAVPDAAAEPISAKPRRDREGPR